MIYYQQSATVDKRLQSCDIKFAKWDTLIGSFATQILMIVVIILGASVLYKEHIAPNNACNFALALVPIAGKYSACKKNNSKNYSKFGKKFHIRTS
jgi:Mn2+/Fe2+ NRAMP family transporter